MSKSLNEMEEDAEERGDSIESLKEYFDLKFKSLKRELSRDVEVSQCKKSRTEMKPDFKYKLN